MKNIEDVSGFGAISFYVAAEPFVELVWESKCLVCVELEVLGGLAGASVFFTVYLIILTSIQFSWTDAMKAFLAFSIPS